MAKKKAAEQETGVTTPELVRLHRNTIEGGYIEVDPEHARRILELEKSMGVENYRYEPNEGEDTGTV